MALVSCKERYERSHSVSIKKGTHTEKQYSRSFVIVTNDPIADDQVAVENYFVTTSGITRGSPFPSDISAFAKDIQCTCVDLVGTHWHLTVQYGNHEHDGQMSPLLQQATYEWSFAQFQRFTRYDVYNQPIVNSAGSAFESIPVDDSRPVLKVTHNEAVFSIGIADIYKDSVNGDVFLTCPPRTVKLSNVSAKNIKDQVYGWYWQVSYEFMFNRNTWDEVLLNEGFEELDSVTHKRKPITDGGGAKVTRPHFLDADGKKLLEGSPVTFVRYEVYNQLPFNVFAF